MSESGRRLFSERGQEASQLIGVSFESYLYRLCCPEIFGQLRTSGLLHGDALLFTFTVNAKGRGNTAIWEPIVEYGRLVGVLNYATQIFHFPDNDEFSFERVAFVPAADPTRLTTLFEGARAGLIAR